MKTFYISSGELTNYEVNSIDGTFACLDAIRLANPQKLGELMMISDRPILNDEEITDEIEFVATKTILKRMEHQN